VDNHTIARGLLDAAHSLEEKHASLYRVKAYRLAAQTILGLDRPIEEMVADAGRKALRDLPGIGLKLSVKIETLVRTGDIATLKGEERTIAAATNGLQPAA
jgi:DNA polymerase/3'-5' exonuclease PolX